MNPENVLVVALLALLWLAGLVASWLKQRRDRQRRLEAQGAEGAAPLTLPPRVIMSAEPPWLPSELAPAPEPPSPPPPPPPPPGRGPSRFRLGDAADVRRAYELMAVLGPPRALEPEDPTSPPAMR